MQITFPGPDGTPITVADTRRETAPNKAGKGHTVVLPEERRPAGWIVSAMKV